MEDAKRHDRLVHVVLDEKTFVRRRPEVEHERQVAICDLIEENLFRPAGGWQGPYVLYLSMEKGNMTFDIRTEAGDGLLCLGLDVKSFYDLVRDYLLTCDTYFTELRNAPKHKMEVADMARRGLHNEGAKLLQDALKGLIDIDFDTARRLFTLLCVLHIKG